MDAPANQRQVTPARCLALRLGASVSVGCHAASILGCHLPRNHYCPPSLTRLRLSGSINHHHQPLDIRVAPGNLIPGENVCIV